MTKIFVSMLFVAALPALLLGGTTKRLRRIAQPNAAPPAVTALLSVPVWTPLGPDPIPNGQTVAISVPVTGRVTAIAVDPTDANIVYVGTPGGLFRTLDGGMTWTPLMDSAEKVTVGAITIDPTDRSIVFVGSGDSNLTVDSFFGVGIYIIRNATTVPSLSGPFNSDGANDVFTGRAISRILVHPTDHNKILVATTSGFSGISGDTYTPLPSRGVFLSTNALDASPTFTKLAIPTTITSLHVTDLVMNPADPAVVLTTLFDGITGNGGVWRSGSDPWSGTATWSRTRPSLSSGKLAGAPSTGTFFAIFDESGGCTGGLRGNLSSSTDGGVTWSLPLAAANGFCGATCFYSMVMAVDPTNAARMYLGGSVPGGCVGILKRSTDGGATFVGSQTSLHVYTHAIAVAPSNAAIVYTGNDGGIFRSTDSGATWSSINTPGLGVVLFHSVSVHPTDRNFTIGAVSQNGPALMDPAGNWTHADHGDAHCTAIDQNAANTTDVTLYHTYFNQANSIIGYAQVTGTANANPFNWTFYGCGGTANGISCTDSVLIEAPLSLGPGTPNTVYFGTDRLYRSINKGVTAIVVSQAPIQANVPISAIGIAPQDDNVRIVGLKNGRLFATTTGSNPLVEITGSVPAKYVARVVIDPNNKNTAYVALNGYGIASHIWKTTVLSDAVFHVVADGWTAASTGLPDVPVNSLTVNPANSNFVFAATDIGVFASIDGGANWSPYGTGLPRVPVFDIAVQKSSQILRIATHGRGMFETAANPFLSAAGMHGDFDGDGHADVLIRDNTGTIGMWLMNGAAITTGALVGSPGGTYTVAGVGDFNGDGKSDILIRDSTGTIGMWLMNGSAITAGALVGSPGGTYSVVAVADFNGDAKADILLRDVTGTLGLWIMNGATIASGSLIGSPGSYTVAAVGDFNGDGRADILLRDNLGSVGMWFMNGATITSGALVGSPGAGYSVAGATDLNGDGKTDIVLRDIRGVFGAWVMNGAAITAGALVGSPGARYVVVSAADFDANNRGDLLLRNTGTGDIGLWFMNGPAIVGGGSVGPLATSSEVVP